MIDFKYAGAELGLFAQARNWKSYWSSVVRPFVTGDVLEVGAALAASTRYLDYGSATRWICLEPDNDLAAQARENLLRFQQARSSGTQSFEVVCGRMQDLAPTEMFDTIAYIDVLEHIESDADELRMAASHLRRNGRLIALSPAHPSLFSPFDAAIGHFRRYNRTMLRKITPAALRMEHMRYLDSAGVFVSAANLVLRQNMPTAFQVRVWDRIVVPISRAVDPLLFNKVGKSILAVWQKAPASNRR